MDETLLPFTDQFKYLGSNVTADGGANKDIIERLGKARNAFRMLNPVWKSQQYKLNTKLKLYRSCVLSTLLYGSECWRMIESDLCKLSSFHTKSLRKIARIFWPRYVSNEDLLEQCQQETMETIIIRRQVEVDRSRTPQGTRCHPSSSRSMEARGTQETRTTENHLEKDSGGRGSSHGTVMGHLEDAGSGP